ncbi:hypothetical protein DITRI_Ditri05aG0120700 [Diplodiscus trichospermus]
MTLDLLEAESVDCLLELVNHRWSKDNGFRAGYLQQLEKWMGEKIPNCQIKGDPHIKSRMKTLKNCQYREVADMLGNAGSRFGWDDVNKCVTCDIDVWNGWVKGYKDVASLRNKPFPHFDELAIIFGKDIAIGDGAETSTNGVENIELEEATVKAALEVYNAMNVDEDANGIFNGVNLESFQESVFFSNTGNTESSTGATRKPAMQSKTEVVRKK